MPPTNRFPFAALTSEGLHNRRRAFPVVSNRSIRLSLIRRSPNQSPDPTSKHNSGSQPPKASQVARRNRKCFSVLFEVFEIFLQPTMARVDAPRRGGERRRRGCETTKLLNFCLKSLREIAKLNQPRFTGYKFSLCFQLFPFLGGFENATPSVASPHLC